MKKREKKKAKKKAERALEEAAKKEEASNSDFTAIEEDPWFKREKPDWK